MGGQIEPPKSKKIGGGEGQIEPSVICGECCLMFSDELQCNSHMREHMHKCYKCNFVSEKEEVKAEAELGRAQYKKAFYFFFK